MNEATTWNWDKKLIENSSSAVFGEWRSENDEEEIILHIPEPEIDDDEPAPKIQSLVDIYAQCNVVATDPVSFEDACKIDVWIDAMKEEITAIERNKTWSLVDCLGNSIDSLLAIVVYVDDLMIIGKGLNVVLNFKSQLCSEFEMTNLGRMIFFLGLEVNRNEKRLFLLQKAYVENLFKKFSMSNCKPVSTPVAANANSERSKQKRKLQMLQFIGV
ncbi:uncharacterized protein LOC110603938 [Manihot esculenta]|uniref:uncharacterized protein LOC110603938 n=1 Tax=Manihot esculenta TaxID=3983 RepID=UPI000B5D91B2|nr:uncharacterized protein LOC110603938 [Manihot esculenta]